MEETSWADPSTGKKRYWLSASEENDTENDLHTIMSEENKEYRRQMHVSQIPGNFLQLGPDQVAVLALSFFPRYPANHETHNVQQVPSFYKDDPPTYQSKYEHADWNDWVQSTRSRRNNALSDTFHRKASYQVKTTLVIETNTETLRIPISGTSVLQNKYGIPSMIMLGNKVEEEAPQQEQVLNQPEDAFVVSRIHPQRGGMSYTEQDNLTKRSDCFDVYIRHPYHSRRWSDRWYSEEPDIDPPVDNLEVKEVSVTRPDLVGLRWNREKGVSADNRAVLRKSISRWSDGRPLTVPPDNMPHYFVTVCALTDDGFSSDRSAIFESGDELIDSFSNQPGSMGFLQIRTSHDNLLVALEEERMVASEDASIQDSKKGDNLNQSRSGQEVESSLLKATAASQNILRALPESLQHVFVLARDGHVNAANETFRFGIKNENHDGIRILRASIVTTSCFDGITIRLKEFNPTLSEMISGLTVVSDALSFECSVDWDILLRNSPSADFSVEGSIIIRATVINRSKQGTQYDTDTFRNSVLLEIPWGIRFVTGNVILATEKKSAGFLNLGRQISNRFRTVKGVFFPFDLRSIAALDQSTLIVENLVVLSDMGNIIRLNEVRVSDELESSQQGTPRTVSHCSRLEAKLSNEVPSREDGRLGLITLTYRLLNEVDWQSSEEGHGHLPTWCYLSFTTMPSTGQHITPVVIYSGSIDVTGSPSVTTAGRETKLKVELQDQHWNHAVGVDSIVDWLNTAQVGSAFSALVDGPRSIRDAPKWGKNDLKRYFYNLNGNIGRRPYSRLVPVLLNVGAILQSDVESVPLYLTNHNPIPVTVSIDVSEVEGLAIMLGQDQSTGSGDGNHPLDYLPNKFSKTESVVDENKILSGTFAGHPIDGLRQFLLRDVAVNKYFSQFAFRDAASLSKYAISRSSFLRSLFKDSAYETFHRKGANFNREDGGCGTSDFPETYGPFSRTINGGGVVLGPIVLSEDGRKVRRTRVCRGAVENSVTISPGGYVRFDVFVRSPPAAVLEQDITRFLSTGLLLSTDHGQIIPILANFEALQGKLDVSHIPSPIINSESREGIIHVPIGLFSKPSSATGESKPVYIPPSAKDDGLFVAQVAILSRNVSDVNRVSLFMRSSFSHDIKVRRIASCNPWFKVELSDTTEELLPTFDPFLGVNIGAVSSNAMCNSSTDITGEAPFPSFFRCVTSWLLQRAELQPRGCGPLPLIDGRLNFKSDVPADIALDKVVRILEKAIVAFEQRDADTKSDLYNVETDKFDSPRYPAKNRSGDGIVSPGILRSAAQTSEAWKTISDLGLQVIATSLRAIIEYNGTSGGSISLVSDKVQEDNPVFSVVIRNVTVLSTLEIPRLVDFPSARYKFPFFSRGDNYHPSTLNFPATLVGSLTSINIPLHNPTAVPVRVRLTVPPFARGSSLKNREGPFADAAVKKFIGQWRPPYIQSSLVDKMSTTEEGNRFWWGPDKAYFQADSNGDITRSHQNVTIKAGSGAKFTLIDPSVMFNIAFLAGCGRRCGLLEDGSKQKRAPFVHGLVGLIPMSPIGASAAAGHFLLGRGPTLSKDNKNRLGDGFESGGSMMLNGRGPSAFAIAKEGLNEIIIPPFGKAELGPIFFRPPGRSTRFGCAAQLGRSPHDHCEQATFESLVFLENSLSGIERIVLTGKSMWTKLEFVDPDPMPNEDDFGDIVFRHGKPSLMFSGSASVTEGYPRPVVKHLFLHNFGDLPVNLTKMSIIHDELFSSHSVLCSTGGFDLLTSFRRDAPHAILLPGGNFSLSIQHRPACNKRTDFVTLSIEYSYREMENNDAVFTASKLPFQRHSVNLTIGYDMLDWEFRSCKPLRTSWSTENWCTESYNSTTSTNNVVDENHAVLSTLCFVLLKLFAITIVLKQMFGRSVARRTQTIIFHHFLKRGQKGESMLNLALAHEMGKDWFAAFRCLARVEPSLLDLQTLGREQTRQIILHRYRMMKIQPPQFFTGAGIFIREMHGTIKQPGSMRTLGDGLFGNFVPSKTRIYGRFPCQLGWRTATARGIIQSTTVNPTLHALETISLYERRIAQHASTDDSQGDQSFDASESSDISITFSNGAETMDASSDKADSSNPKGNAGLTPSSAELKPLSSVASVDKTRKAFEDEHEETEQFEIPTKVKSDLSSTIPPYQQSKVLNTAQKKIERAPKWSAEKNIVQLSKRPTAKDSREPTEDVKLIIVKDSNHSKISKHQRSNESRKKPAPQNNTGKSGSGRSSETDVASETKRTHLVNKVQTQTNPWKLSTSIEGGERDKEIPQNIRPPPGLAPPPGFSGHTPSEMTVVANPDSHYHRLLREAAEASSSYSQHFNHTELPSPNAFTAEHPPLPNSPPDRNDSHFLTHAHAHRATESFHIPESTEFDVMAFLDDILNEGSKANNGVADTKESEPEGILRDDEPAFSPNPWATSDIYQSRAAAYGILIEDESTRGTESSDLPLLTPEAILSSAVSNEDDESVSNAAAFFSDFGEQG
ncbi:hypothetical protein FisN_23Lh080 [Fistulifera solaris]|uniref:Uncharacterized protein n=1 Tax=Fistulifera solaris TaxID=1519565 RepID=A0A1Z5KMK6_FISSO|nr:hypothetical protein FisN_23Lh080 [Fistulifera solaris]|eukprot:GAX27345.1 hypothetical protein FisN_23Lh080 [Fistulifera solaris]